VERGAREWSEGDDGGFPCRRPLLDGAAHHPSGRQVEIVQQSGLIDGRSGVGFFLSGKHTTISPLTKLFYRAVQPCILEQ
jgi:hypothetical protein